MRKFEISPLDAPDVEAVKKRIAANRAMNEAAEASAVVVDDNDTRSDLVIMPKQPVEAVPVSPLLEKKLAAQNRSAAPAQFEAHASPIPVRIPDAVPEKPQRIMPGVPVEEMVVLKQTEGGQELGRAETTYRLDDAPAVPEAAPEAKKWYAKVWERAKAYVAPIMERFSTAETVVPEQPEPAKKTISLELQALRAQRAEWHDLAQQLFSPDKAVAAAAKEAVIGRVLDLGDQQHYTIEKVLGQGSFGSAFVAKDATGVQRVVKLSQPFDRRKMYFNADTPVEQQFASAVIPRALIMEVATLHRLKKLGEQNPSPEFIDAQFMPDPRDANQRMAVLVMELVDGQTLDQFANAHQSDPSTTVDAIQQLTVGLETAHRAGVIHSDIKPANVMVSKDGRVKLIDFGAAVIPELQSGRMVQTNSGEFIVPPPIYAQESALLASPVYAPDKEIASKARDRYSLGRTIQRLVFGQARFRKEESMQELMPSLSYPLRELAEIAKQLVRKEPAKRISLERTKVLLEELRETEEGIEVIEDQIAQVN